MRWPGYLRVGFDSRNCDSEGDQHQADRVGLLILRETVCWPASFRRGAPHGAVRMGFGDIANLNELPPHSRQPRSCSVCSVANYPIGRQYSRAPHRHELGTAVHRWNVGKYRRLWHTMHRPAHRKSRGRTTRSTQLSGGAILNWSPLHTRQCADNKCILGFVTLFSITNSSSTSHREVEFLPAIALASAGVSRNGSHSM